MSKLTHLDESGAARMVDVGGKPATQRRAVASGRITMSAEALAAIREGNRDHGRKTHRRADPAVPPAWP